MLNMNHTSARILAHPGQYLDLGYVADKVPSIAALEAHESRSERYTQIRTLDVLRGLQKEGFEVIEARQGRCRNKAKQEYTKHLLWLQHRDALQQTERKVGDEFFRIGLLNSHDGTSSYRLMSGVFRLVCLNGMVTGQTYSDVRVPHRGDVTGRVIEGVYSVVGESEQVVSEIADMRALTLNDDAQTMLATAAAQLRWEDPEKMPIQPRQLLQARRWEDRGADLWTTFNRVQENVLKGGQRGRINPDSGRRMGARVVTSIDEDIRINRNLWDIASAIVAINKQAV